MYAHFKPDTSNLNESVCQGVIFTYFLYFAFIYHVIKSATISCCLLVKILLLQRPPCPLSISSCIADVDIFVPPFEIPHHWDWLDIHAEGKLRHQTATWRGSIVSVEWNLTKMAADDWGEIDVAREQWKQMVLAACSFMESLGCHRSARLWRCSYSWWIGRTHTCIMEWLGWINFK